MSILFTDNFNRANGSTGANWSTIGSQCQIVSNQAQPPASATLDYWNGGTPAADCWAEKVASTNVVAPGNLGLALRFDTATLNGYYVGWDTGGATIYSFAGGAPTAIGATAFTPPGNGVKVRLEMRGTTLSLYYDDVLQTTRTDATYASANRSGVVCSVTTARFDDFATGSLPTISAADVPNTSATSLRAVCTTDDSSGTLYMVADTASLAGITASQIKAGQNASGSAAAGAGNSAVSGSPAAVTVTGLSSATSYNLAILQFSGGNSNILTITASTQAATTAAASAGPGIVVGGSSSFVGEGAVGAPDTTSGLATAVPSKATLTTQGLVPALLTTYQQTQPVGAGIVSVGGLIPLLLREQLASPGVAGLSIGGLTPALYRELVASPAPSALAAAGLQPALTKELLIAPGVGLATTLGQAPAVAGDSPAPGGTASPGVGAATMAGLAPTLYLERLVAPGSGAVTVQGLVPGELLELLGLPGAGAAQVQGLAPQLLRELLLQPGSALAQALGLAPAEGLERTVTPGVGLSIVNGYAPTYGVPGQAITEPGSAALAAVGLAPTLVGLELPLAPDVGVATVVGLAPTISGTSSAEPIGRSYVGQKKRGARGRTSQTIYDYSADAVVAAPTQGPPPTVPGTPQPLRLSLGELGGLDLRAALAPRPAAPIVAPDDTAAAEERARIRRRREERLILSILMAA